MRFFSRGRSKTGFEIAQAKVHGAKKGAGLVDHDDRWIRVWHGGCQSHRDTFEPMSVHPPLNNNGWLPSADAIAGGNASQLRYEDAPPWAGGTNCGGSFRPGARLLREQIRRLYPEILDIGGYACRPNTANTAQTSMHGSGRALDIMIRPLSGGVPNLAIGNPIADWLVTNAEWIGVQCVIWSRNIYSVGRSPRFTGYTGPNSHTDHIHAEITEEAAAMRTPFFTNGLIVPEARASAGVRRSLVVMMALAAAGGAAAAVRLFLDMEDA